MLRVSASFLLHSRAALGRRHGLGIIPTYNVRRITQESDGIDGAKGWSNLLDRGSNVGIDVITKSGFVLSNNVKIDQPIVLLHGTAFLWRAARPMWNLEGLSIFDIVTPKPELVIFGTGKSLIPLPSDVRDHFYQNGIQVDQMSTKHAASTYNVLVEEGRRVAAVLVPLNHELS